ARPVLSIEGSRATEYGYVLFTVRLSEPATDAVSVDYQAYSGTAERDVDFSDYGSASLSGTLTFGIGETVQTFTVYVGHDTLDEIDENFFVELSDPVGATFGPGNATLVATGWVLDDDGAGLNRSISVSSAELREGPGGRFAVFAVELSSPSNEAITLNFQTLGGTAKAGSDFVARAGQVTFAPNQTRIEISVRVNDDLALEGTEQFYLRITPPYPSQISSLTPTVTGTATILDGTIRGTGGNDILAGTAFADRIEGFGGNDSLSGLAGNDILAGGTGNDTLNGGLGADRLLGGLGNDLYLVDAGDILVEGAGGGIDTVNSAASHVLGANIENLTLIGAGAINGTGNGLANLLTGNAARNILTGGRGNDTYVIGAGDTVRELAGQGTDTIRAGISVTLGAHVENLVLTGGAAVNGTGNALANVITGNAARNVLTGGGGNDTYFVQAGDTVREFAGQGIDTVRTGASWTLAAHVENLTLLGQAGSTGVGNALNNRLQGNGGNNTLLGGSGNDTLLGAAGQDTIGGGNGSDLLQGDSGNDILRGGGGADSLLGGFGNDYLEGDAGFDRLTGGAGADLLRGGGEADVFIFSAVADSRPGLARDRIADFARGVDDMDLTQIDANFGAAGNQAFAFRGTTAAAHSVWYVRQGANALVQGDVNGDGVADFQILLNNVSALTAADFML
ncbi:Calx-beta domain-containing protein, partial [Paracoccus sp. (in: a-proteobacteria)]|uniref:Calx-beta domain-containing protein n=1 Tax=Paracoccus sp. TaxID=267 RepID=UPI0035AF284B